MAKALVGAGLRGKEVKTVIVETMKGRALVGMEYEPLFMPWSREGGEVALCRRGDTYVTMSDGTGIVHIAPAFGEDDARVGRQV